VPSLHFLLLLFEHLSVVQRNIGVDGGRHGGTEEKSENFFCLCIVDLGTIIEFFR